MVDDNDHLGAMTPFDPSPHPGAGHAGDAPAGFGEPREARVVMTGRRPSPSPARGENPTAEIARPREADRAAHFSVSRRDIRRAALKKRAGERGGSAKAVRAADRPTELRGSGCQIDGSRIGRAVEIPNRDRARSSAEIDGVCESARGEIAEGADRNGVGCDGRDRVA